VQCEFALRSNSHENKTKPSAAIRTKGYFLACARITTWQRWSLLVLSSASVKMYEQTACYQKKNWGKPERLRGLYGIGRLEARANSRQGQGWKNLCDRYLPI